LCEGSQRRWLSDYVACANLIQINVSPSGNGLIHLYNREAANGMDVLFDPSEVSWDVEERTFVVEVKK